MGLLGKLGSPPTVAACCCSDASGSRSVSLRQAQAAYLGLFGAAVVVAIVLRNRYKDGDQTVVFRVCAASAAWFAAMLAGSLAGRLCCRARKTSFHRGWWIIKVPSYAAVLVAGVLLPGTPFESSTFGWVARAGAITFVFLQVPVLANFVWWGFTFNQRYVDQAFDGTDDVQSPRILCLIIAASALLYVFTISGLVVLLVFFKECYVHFVWITLVAVVLLTGLTLGREWLFGVPGAILPAGVVSAYSVYQCATALASSREPECRQFTPFGESLLVVASLVATFFALVWTSFAINKHARQAVINGGLGGGSRQQDDREGQVMVGAYAIGYDDDKASGHRAANDGEGEDEDEDEDDGGDYAWLFHFVMVSASLYAAMMLTRWGTDLGSYGESDDAPVADNVNVWVKIVAEWVLLVTYFVILVAPRIASCLGREYTGY